MQVLDPGHRYQLATLDRDPSRDHEPELRFVKRVGEKYPGNEAPGYEGTTTQEVIRALIDRTKYVNAQIYDWRNYTVIVKLREALGFLEHRAAECRGELQQYAEATTKISHELGIEALPTCAICGHIACGKHVEE